jgi:hypothetical protein
VKWLKTQDATRSIFERSTYAAIVPLYRGIHVEVFIEVMKSPGIFPEMYEYQTLIELHVCEGRVSICCLPECIQCITVFSLSDSDDSDGIPESSVVGICFKKGVEQGSSQAETTHNVNRPIPAISW